jgi:hypothetical protein
MTMGSRSSSIVAGALALALVLAVGSAMAQSSVSLRADIPFEFTVGKATMPAGEYSVRSLAQPYVVAIAAVDHSAQAALITQGAEAVTATEQAKLVFRKYGDRYFLAEIWSLGTRMGHRLPVTGTERELTKRAANYQVVAVLAKR